MATKKTTKDSAASKAAAKKTAAKPAKTAKAAKPAKAATARHPLGRVKERHGSKEDLVKILVEPLANGTEDTDVLRGRLLKASNHQLLRLQRVVATVKDKWGGRDKLIDAIGKAMNKAKDQDYLARLATFSLPRLLELATATARRAQSR